MFENTPSIIDVLKSEARPIVMYGTGNGAEKLYSELKKYGISVAEIFASDSFKKGKQFLSHEVLHLGDIKEKYNDFVVVLGFATDRSELLDYIKALKNDLNGSVYMPEVPVFGDGFFTPDILRERRADIAKLYSLLADEQSKKVLEGVIEFKLSGNIDKLFNIETEKAEVYKNIIKPCGKDDIVDIGAYNGDTLLEFANAFKCYREIIAIEPAPKNFEKLKATVNTNNISNVRLLEKAVSDKSSMLYLSSKSGRSPYLTGNGKLEIETISLDSLKLSPTFIKYDVEGEELNALKGSHATIAENLPDLSVSVYHKMCDFIDIPLYVNSLYPEYKLYLRHHPYLPSWETNLYAVK